MFKKHITIILSFLMVFSMILSSCAPAPATQAPKTEAAKTEAPKTEAAIEASKTEAPKTEVATEAPKTEAPKTEVAKSGKSRLTYIEAESFFPLDPFTTPYNGIPQYSIFHTLVILTPDFKSYIPGLAEKWDIAPDNTEITLYLRKDATYFDGSPIDAESIKWNFDMYMDEKLASAMGGDVRDYVKEVKVLDPYSLKITLKAPYAPFLMVLASLQMASKTGYEKVGADKFTMEPVGSGMWIPKEIVQNSHILYEANPNFKWNPSVFKNPGPAKYDEFMIKFIQDDSVAYAQLETGEAQIIKIAPQYLEKAKQNPNIQVVEGLNTKLTYIGINNENPLLKNAAIRQALAYALNREEVVQVGYEGQAVASYSPLTPSEIGYSEEMEAYSKKSSNDPAKAKEILEKDGWKLGSDNVYAKDGKKLEIKLAASNNVMTQRMVETIQSQMAEVGIKIDLELLEADVIKGMTNEGTHELIFWFYSSLDPNILTYIFHSSRIGSSNRNRVNDPELDKLIEAADQEIDPVKRNEKVSTLMKRLIDQRYHIPLLTDKTFAGYRKDLVKGLVFTVTGDVLMGDAEPVK